MGLSYRSSRIFSATRGARVVLTRMMRFPGVNPSSSAKFCGLLTKPQYDSGEGYDGEIVPCGLLEGGGEPPSPASIATEIERS